MISYSLLSIGAEQIAAAVSDEEYRRLLQLPRSRELTVDLMNHIGAARSWYAQHGTPFVAYQRFEPLVIGKDEVMMQEKSVLRSKTLADRLLASEAYGLVVLIATAGAEVSDEVKMYWSEGRPDDAYFLDRFAAAVTEQLVRSASILLCRAGEQAGETLLPHLSPGCNDWDLSDQHSLLAMLTTEKRIGPVELLSTGALSPQYSVFAVAGITHHTSNHSTKMICAACDLDPCNFRRSPFRSV